MKTEIANEETHWKIAVAEIVKKKKGDLIDIKDLEKWFGVPFDSKEWAFQWLPMQNELLWEHGIALSRIKGVLAYSVATDDQIVQEHVNRAWKQILSSLRRLGRCIQIVDTSKLTDESSAVLERRTLQAGYLMSHMSTQKKQIANMSDENRTKAKRLVKG